MERSFSAVQVIIAINVVIYFATTSLAGDLFNGLALYFPTNDNFGIWQFVSHMFMHGGIVHLLFNMFGLWMFATPLEKIWGKARFLMFYFVSGIGAALIYTAINYYDFNAVYNELIVAGLPTDYIQMMLDENKYPPSLVTQEQAERLFIHNTPMVGASGALYGILVAFAVLFPNTKLALIFLPVPIAAKYFIPAIISLDLFSGITGFSIFGGGIAHFAHVGGALIGFLLMMYWRKKLGRPELY